ncbi:hypothetical protein KIPB_000327 [Kipferlia bialata]|uniref:Rho-GAP domain-containing protein n=1 Tax=Kipferlia bialata TaxID=797122 RepID=A0A9K3CNW6_9EUKA|nr:hypothetical protein KIPB_000327 [Kipferlia bialata]|eukprot:g327.t1
MESDYADRLSVEDHYLWYQMMEREPEYVDWMPMPVMVASWNVNNKKPPATGLRPWLVDPLPEGHFPELYVVGLQEVDLSAAGVMLGDTNKAGPWRLGIDKALTDVAEGVSYTRLADRQLAGIYLSVYVRCDVRDLVRGVMVRSIGTGLMGVMGNKGAVTVSLIFRHSRMVFVNSHLAARTSNVARRNKDYADIVSRVMFPSPRTHIVSGRVIPTAHTPSPGPVDSRPTHYEGDGLSIVEEGEGEGERERETVNSGTPNLSLYHTCQTWESLFMGHDYCVWLGDLNYRITPVFTYEETVEMATSNKLAELLEHDQLLIEHAAKRVFHSFVEPPISFRPTYKFTPGTNTYAPPLEDKVRPPAWCDRILVRVLQDPEPFVSYLEGQATPPPVSPCSAAIGQYHSLESPSLAISDHMPVFCTMTLAVKSVDKARRESVKEHVQRELDRVANDMIPKVEVSPTDHSLDFGLIGFGGSVTRSLTLTNVGKVAVAFGFKPLLGASAVCPPWVSIECPSRVLAMGKSAEIKITMQGTPRAAQILNQGHSMDCLLLLSVTSLASSNGPDKYISLSGSWKTSVFGAHLERVVRLETPILEAGPLPPECVDAPALKVCVADSASPVPPLKMEAFPASPIRTVPAELWRLIDLLEAAACGEYDRIYEVAGNESDDALIRECLDTGSPLPSVWQIGRARGTSSTTRVKRDLEREGVAKGETGSMEVSIDSVAGCVLQLLSSLPVPVVPSYSAAMLARTHSQAMSVVSSMPASNVNVLVYVLSHVERLLQSSRANHWSREGLCALFGGCLMRPPAGSPRLVDREAQFLMLLMPSQRV